MNVANIPQTKRYLLFIDPCMGSNNYFEMIPCGSTFTVKYNQIGYDAKQMTYPIEKWDAIYMSKIIKGYVDKSDIHYDQEEMLKEKGKEIKIEPNMNLLTGSIAEIVEILRNASMKQVQTNYKQFETATPAMINKAQDILNELVSVKELFRFNMTLTKLFETIPRKMNNSMDFCAKSEKDFVKIIQREQEILDNLRAILKGDKKNNPVQVQKNILEQNGISIEECSKKEIEEIKNHLDSNTRPRFSRVWKVRNFEAEEKFERYAKEKHIKEFRYFYHGSRTENWWSILTTNLTLRPTGAVITGKMFGYGLYFAPLAKKSCGYISTRNSYWSHGSDAKGYLAVYKIAYGKPLDVYKHDSYIGRMDEKTLKKDHPDCNCVHAHAGSMLMNDEVIVYNDSACTIRYLIEINA